MRLKGLQEKIDWAEYSCCGEREYNEDAIRTCAAGAGLCFALADGLGGHGYGEEASRMAVDICCEIMERTSFSKDSLDRCFRIAQEKILEKQRSINNKNALKTTLVLLVIENGRALYGHIGDSRLYCFSGAKKYWRTMDHSVPQLMAQAKKIKDQDIRFNEDRNRLLRVLGMECEELRHEIAEPVSVRKGDAFLLCSDGWWEWITEDEMMNCLKRSQTPKQWIEEMRKVVIEKGSGKGMDNYSAVAVFTGER